MNLKKERKVSRENIRRLGAILEEFLIGNLENEFPVGGHPAPVEPEVEDVEEQPDHEDADLFDEAKYYYDLADVQYCVDVAITEIVNEKLLPRYHNPQKPPTLPEIFQFIFGEGHELTKQVDEFVELISGYEDNVHIDDLREADKLMKEIITELKDWGGN